MQQNVAYWHIATHDSTASLVNSGKKGLQGGRGKGSRERGGGGGIMESQIGVRSGRGGKGAKRALG